MQFQRPIAVWSIGALIALLVIIVVIIFAVTGHALDRDWILAGFAALAVARLL